MSALNWTVAPMVETPKPARVKVAIKTVAIEGGGRSGKESHPRRLHGGEHKRLVAD